jgi:hypothetical protein
MQVKACRSTRVAWLMQVLRQVVVTLKSGVGFYWHVVCFNGRHAPDPNLDRLIEPL